jgi:hypothetical protein
MIRYVWRYRKDARLWGALVSAYGLQIVCTMILLILLNIFLATGG